MMVTVRPLTYKEATEINTRSFELRRQLYNVSGIEDEELKTGTWPDNYYDKAIEIKLINEMGTRQKKALRGEISELSWKALNIKMNGKRLVDRFNKVSTSKNKKQKNKFFAFISIKRFN